MDTTMIRNWNSRVKSEDNVFFLGDFCFKRSKEAPEGKVWDYYRKQLNGNIVFIRGNHDRNNNTPTIIQNIVIYYASETFFMTHDPKFVSYKFRYNLVGHVHNLWKCQKGPNNVIMLNVGVDAWDFRPININEIMSEITRFSKKA
jgi:calcineurin-like phosphoesterase family protein